MRIRICWKTGYSQLQRVSVKAHSFPGWSHLVLPNMQTSSASIFLLSEVHLHLSVVGRAWAGVGELGTGPCSAASKLGAVCCGQVSSYFWTGVSSPTSFLCSPDGHSVKREVPTGRHVAPALGPSHVHTLTPTNNMHTLPFSAQVSDSFIFKGKS